MGDFRQGDILDQLIVAIVHQKCYLSSYLYSNQVHFQAFSHTFYLLNLESN